MRYRYGRFRFFDYTGSWIAILICVCMATLSLLVNLYWGALVWFIIPIPHLLCIILPHFERYEFKDGEICARTLLGEKKITLPEEVTLVISYADIAPPLAVRTYANTTHILREKYWVSILIKSDASKLDDSLSQNRLVTKFVSTHVGLSVPEHMQIYGFVLDFEIVLQLKDKAYNVLIPKSLLHISESLNLPNVHIIDRY